MRYGHYFNYGYHDNLIIYAIITGLLVLGMLLAISLRKRTDPGHRRLKVVLDERLAAKEIDIQEYEEIKALLEEDVSSEAAMMVVKERYAYGDLNMKEYIRMRDLVNSKLPLKKTADLLRLKYATGEINEGEFRDFVNRSR